MEIISLHMAITEAQQWTELQGKAPRTTFWWTVTIPSAILCPNLSGLALSQFLSSTALGKVDQETELVEK